MQIIKSLLLGSTAGIVAVASAQAADLPTKKGAPAAEYVKVCSITVNGTPIVGFTLPGSDTCLKISGYDSAQFTYGPARTTTQNAIGFFNRGQVNFDAASNTAMGPLLAHIELQGDYGTNFDSRYGVSGANARTQINNAYIQWAGLTVGKHASYFDFLAGGAAWDDIISPDHSGGPVPLAAYTASFGGGFSATLSLEAPEGTGATGTSSIAFLPSATAPAGAVNTVASPYTAGGDRAPDVVGQLAVSQAWGGAQLSGVLHNTRGTGSSGAVFATGPLAATAAGAGSSVDKWGYALLGGLKFNIPGMAGADLKLQGVYAYDAAQYSGLGSAGDFNFAGATGEGGLNGSTGFPDFVLQGNGGPLALLANSTAWSVAGIVDLPVSATFKISPEASYGSITWSNGGGGVTAFVGGGVLEWVPVKNLTFDLDLLYATGTTTAASNAFAGTTTGGGAKTNFDAFTAKLRIERDF